ncbi:DUF4781 domain-containing protein [Inquilinus sp. YAF38]|uniref:DUF4781 domain-containing protein n=1 Tax=Inquilinus sp. YAF38 TaxID=3233084 RepID=UPI003F8DD072
MSLAPLRRGEGEPQLRGSGEASFASAVERAKKPVPAARAREIDEWVRDKVKDHTLRFWKDDGAETAAKALQGDSDLGDLTAAEQARLVDRVLRKWQGDGASSAQDLAGRVRGDTDLARLVADRLAARSVELQAGKRGDEKLDPDLMTARSYAEAAVLALGYDPERPDFTAKLDTAGLQALVGSRPRDQASAFAAMLAHQPRALASAVSAMADAPAGEARDGFVLSAFALSREQTYFDALGLPQDMGRALAKTFGQPGEGERLGEILATPEGRKLLVEQLPFPQQGKTTPEARGQVLALVLQHRGITAEVLQRSPGGDPWASPAVAKPMAQAAADQALQAGQSHGMELAGAETLESRVARAMGLKHEGEDGKTIDRIAAAIRDPSGAKVTVLPVQFSSSASGAVQLPLFRVEGKDGAVRFVDNQGGRYADFATWKRENRLPPGNMTYPRDGELSGKDGHAVLDSGNTPRTPDSFGEHVEQALDKAALFGGVVAGGLTVIGSGGTAAPAVAAGAGAWFAWRGAEEAGALQERGLDQWDNPEYRMALFNTVAGGASVLPFGRLAYLAQTGKTGEAGRVWTGINGTAMAADGAAMANTGYTLAANWDDLAPGQRLEMGFGVALWGGLTLAVGRSGRVSADQPRIEVTDSAGRDPEAADGPQVPFDAPPGLPRRETWKAKAGRELRDLPGIEVGHLYFIDVRRATESGEGVLADGTAVTAHEAVIQADATFRHDRPIVLNMSDTAAGDRRFAQDLADAARAPVYVRHQAGGWMALQPSASTQTWKVEVQGRDLYRVEPDGTRHRIDDVGGLLGPRLGAGDFKTAFAFGDKAVLVVRSAKHDETTISGFKEMAMLNQLDEAGLPVARPLGLIRVGGRPALLVDRYVAGSKDMLDRTGNTVVDTSRLNENSLLSLQRIRLAMQMRKIDIRDVQFLMKEDGSFVVADPVAVHMGSEPSPEALGMLDKFIAATEAKLGHHG